MLVNQFLLLILFGVATASSCIFRLHSGLESLHTVHWLALDAHLAEASTKTTDFKLWRFEGLPDAVAACPATSAVFVLIYGSWSAPASMFVHEVRRFVFALRPNEPQAFALLLTTNDSSAFRDPDAMPGLDGVVKFANAAETIAHVSLVETNKRNGALPTLLLGLPLADHQRHSHGADIWKMLLEFRDIVGRSVPRPSRPRLGMIYYRPTNGAIGETEFEGGFVTALNKLEAAGLYQVTWLNAIDVENGLHNDLDPDSDFDVLAFKSNWEWIVDRWARHVFSTNPSIKGTSKRVLLISGVHEPPKNLTDFLFYDVLVYETEWYKPAISHHPRIQRAFGVDTDVFRPLTGVTKTWDYMFVGALVPYKRPELLMTKPGRKLAIGRLNMAPDMLHFQDYTDRLVATFQANDVTVSPPAGFQDLNLLYNQAHTVFIPAPVEGGGERAVLEARASGVAVEVAADNPKLQELLHGPVPSTWDYAVNMSAAFGMALCGGRSTSGVDHASVTIECLTQDYCGANRLAVVIHAKLANYRLGIDGIWCIYANNVELACSEGVNSVIALPATPQTECDVDLSILATMDGMPADEITAILELTWFQQLVLPVGSQISIQIGLRTGFATRKPHAHYLTMFPPFYTDAHVISAALSTASTCKLD